MINPKLILLFLACMSVLVWACRPTTTPEESVQQIAGAIERDNFAEATHLVKEMMGLEGELDSVSVERLCLLSSAAARLGDESPAQESEDYTGFALRCYERALQRDSAGVKAYVDEMSSEAYRYMSIVMQLKRSMDHRRLGLPYSENEEDSI